MRLDRFSNSDFNRGASLPKEALWHLVKMIFFLPAFPWPSALRCQLLRLFGANVGKGVRIRERTNISMPWRLKIGNWSWLGEGVSILSLDQVTIGSHCCISQEVYLCTGSHDTRHEDFPLTTKPIVVGDSVWIAARSFIAPGVTIGDNTIIKAGSVVFSVMPADTICGGNPCQKLKMKNEE